MFEHVGLIKITCGRKTGRLNIRHFQVISSSYTVTVRCLFKQVDRQRERTKCIKEERREMMLDRTHRKKGKIDTKDEQSTQKARFKGKDRRGS